ncbi:Abortive infection bacteriophage resistance protein [Mycoplasmopsis maculosa]|uniref:Abortive infection bacteriophage resistance protein n=1 Tax=Mycoplasmopsis maculosa TaxID=114885 RepID=A0A449B571_9BACT|nr:Abi family protein [Mycoplasmopsis maculosa]VEU75754.1 Abortive infection bacteriophage resistance protein [Mycoplasmopsis maculosa]
MNKKIKTILTTDEQINLLEEWGLKWEDDYSRNILKIYLKNYGYKHIVYSWKPYTFINKSGINKKVDSLVKSKNFIQLFNFDRKIAKFVLTNIQNIEIKFRNSILNAVKLYLDKLNIEEVIKNKLNNMQIFNWSISELLIFFKKSINKNKNITSFIEELKNKISNFSNIYLWDILHKTSFGELIRFYSFLKNEIKELVLKHFQDIIPFLSINIEQLLILMKIFKKIRNVICHNDILIRFKHSLPNKKNSNFNEINNFFINNSLKINMGKKIKIMDVIKIISFFNKYSGIKKSLYDIIIETFNSEINTNLFNKKIIQKIKDDINF